MFNWMKWFYAPPLVMPKKVVLLKAGIRQQKANALHTSTNREMLSIVDCNVALARNKNFTWRQALKENGKQKDALKQAEKSIETFMKDNYKRTFNEAEKRDAARPSESTPEQRPAVASA